jgi:hypothetical protein
MGYGTIFRDGAIIFLETSVIIYRTTPINSTQLRSREHFHNILYTGLFRRTADEMDSAAFVMNTCLNPLEPSGYYMYHQP